MVGALPHPFHAVLTGCDGFSDEDARPAGSAHPQASLWDNGPDPVTELERTRTIRRLAISRFGERNLPPGAPLAELEERLAPLYFFHRFQIAAAAKVIGGLDYRHALKGDGPARMRGVRGDEQRRAIDALLAALGPAELDLPEPLLQRLAPRLPGEAPHGELFRHATRPAFDALGAAASLSDLVLAALLDPARSARLVDFHRRSPEMPGLEDLLERLVTSVFADPTPAGPRLAELGWVVQRVAVDRLLALADDPAATPAVRARVREWGGEYPRAWLFWMHLLAREQEWSAVAEAAAEALPLVSHRRPLRARIAEHPADAGRKTGRADWVLDGYREPAGCARAGAGRGPAVHHRRPLRPAIPPGGAAAHPRANG